MIHRLFILCAMIIASSVVLAETREPLLFDSHARLELTIAVNFDTLCRPSETPDCEYRPTVLEYRDAAGHQRSVPVSIRRRDGWRALQTNCQVPTLFVRFSEQDTAGTPFEGQSSLALTSHCGKGVSPENIPSRSLPSEFERYVINEYLGYRIYNQVTDVSLRVKLVRITYANLDNPRLDITRDAFFSEHFDSLAKRFDATLLPAQSFDPEKLDIHAADKIALFQYMIGNTDWSIPMQDNIILLQFPNDTHVPVIYDLDMSGLVSAHYAVPAPRLPINTVKQRFYMGYCHPDTDWDALFAQFTGMQKTIWSMLADTPGLGRGDQRMSGAYMDSFFKILNSPKSRQRKIVEACKPWPFSGVDFMSPVK